MLEKIRRAAQKAKPWPTQYVNADTGKAYQPHHDAEAEAVYNDTPHIVLFRGGEGSGKTVAGSIKALNRLKRGMSGIAVAPNLPHFRRSTWPELRRWLPWEQVVEQHRYRQSFAWEPHGQFMIAFQNGATLLCGGIEDPGSWEGPNVTWALIDEPRHLPNGEAFKVLNGRVRIPGPAGEPPQLWLMSTTRMNWLYEMFGPVRYNDAGEVDDPYADVKAVRQDVILLASDNQKNLDPGYLQNRAMGLSETEQRVLLEGAWEDVDNPERFLAEMLWWDACREELPQLGPNEPLIVALDAGVDNDCFGMVTVSRHPDRKRARTDAAVRFAQAWYPKGKKLDFQAEGGPEPTLRNLCSCYNVLYVAYDPYQLHDMATRLSKEKIAVFREFVQGADRAEADTALRDLILRRGIAHDGNPELRRHIDNADRKVDAESRKLRIVKRAQSLKVDLAVALSMATYTLGKLPSRPSWEGVMVGE